jgi:hypothetical protein
MTDKIVKESHHSCFYDIFPDNVKINKFSIFNEIQEELNNKKNNVDWGIYNEPLCREYMYNLIYDACDSKKISIINLFSDEKEIISTDIYFLLTNSDYKGYKNVFCNYYFKKENIVACIHTGTGNQTMEFHFYFILNLNTYESKFFSSINSFTCSNEYLVKILRCVSNIDENIENILQSKPILKTIYGGHFSCGHFLVNDISGMHICHETGLFNLVDEIIFGPSDCWMVEPYFKNQYKNMNIINKEVFDDLDETIHRGILFKYNHYYISNKCVKFVHNYIRENSPITNEIQNEICFIKDNYYPIFSVNLRCIGNEMYNQADVLSELFNKLYEKYPNAYFLIAGFFGGTNTNSIASSCDSTSETLITKYIECYISIKNKLKTENVKSLINLGMNNILEFTNISNFVLYQNVSYSHLGQFICKIPGIVYGINYIDHHKNFMAIHKEDSYKLYYLEAEKMIFDNPFISTELQRYSVTSEVLFDAINFYMEL